ncbi:DUF1292 domain-containing protein [Vagococcus coleopterorum]|uniref:UPF0473 protein G7081_00635 n=1 Tax=Vagococcus coleopterorum TaxID=2714946 RepID=A0A6G8AL90_9ENTE|nr:DUF1292 domain-containing protein [Vagococcus coleopterorum]QIL45695.1 DUF1292 domain-containing protein [Vagococcus coleopterorum]
MTEEHNHEQETEFITLIDDEGNESLFEILLTIDGEEEFANKQYVLLFPAGVDEDDTDVELLAYQYIETEGSDEGELKNIETDAEWDMIEEVFNTFVEDADA